MNVSIDLENLVFLHKHANQQVVCDLVVIEAPHVTTCVCTLNGRMFSSLTDYEKGLLYTNTTGEKPSGDLDALLYDVAYRMEPTKASPGYAEKQALKLGVDNEVPHTYVHGSNTPAPVDSQARLTVEPTSGEPVRPPAVETPPPAPTPKPTPKAAPSGPRGGTSAVIWEVADALWEKEGRPTEKAALLALRKRIMDVLETDHGAKRTTASSALGKWQAEKIKV